MNFSDLKTIKELSNELDLDFKELANNFINNTDDFEVDNYRFIKSSEIDEIQKNELLSDNYILGCFNADFIADNTPLTYNIVKALQKAEAYEELGEIMVEYIDDIQSEYSRLDGYGHHFAQYDHQEHEVEIDMTKYYYFRIN